MTLEELVDSALTRLKTEGAIPSEVTVLRDQCLYRADDHELTLIVVLSDGTFFTLQCTKETLH